SDGRVGVVTVAVRRNAVAIGIEHVRHALSIHAELASFAARIALVRLLAGVFLRPSIPVLPAGVNSTPPIPSSAIHTVRAGRAAGRNQEEGSCKKILETHNSRVCTRLRRLATAEATVARG